MTLAIDPRLPAGRQVTQGRTRLVLMDGRRVVATRDVADKDGMLAAVDAIVARRGGAAALARIGIVAGGGSFSGVRQAVVIARTISFCLQIPARAFHWRGEEPSMAEIVSAGKPLTRVAYAGSPNITLSKRRARR